MLASLGVAEMLGIIVGADVVSHSKPSPEMLYKILEFYRYDKNSDKAWMIGDNSKDMQSAKNANIEALFATWGFTPHTDFKVQINNPKEVVSIVL
jgi:phosphoglycolate phosphatase